MVQNLCGGVNNPEIFGPPEQTLFLGCSISAFSVNIGWNEQVGDLTVTLVRDTCPVPVGASGKVYYDATLTRQTTMGADPGFIQPNIGSPVYFRVGDFEWSGLVQGFTENGSINGKPTYTVKLVDPRQVLEGTQLIIGDYADSVSYLPNLINCYAYAESFGYAAPPSIINGATFGSPAGGFGGSLSNDNGMPWFVIKEAVSILTSSFLPVINNYSPYGRITFRNGGGTPSGGAFSETAGYGIIAGDGIKSNYLVDLSEMPAVPNYWRIAGTSVSLMDAISQVCSDACSDYYVEFLPTKVGSAIYNVIKIRTASRTLPPVLGAIDSFINSHVDRNAVYTKGIEMRNEVVAAMVVGGKIQSVYQAYQDNNPVGNSWDMISPYFGLDINGNVIESFRDNANECFKKEGVYFTADLRDLNAQLNFPLTINTAKIYETELLASQVSQERWISDGSAIYADNGQLQKVGYESDNTTWGDEADAAFQAGIPVSTVIPCFGYPANAGFDLVNALNITNNAVDNPSVVPRYLAVGVKPPPGIDLPNYKRRMGFEIEPNPQFQQLHGVKPWRFKLDANGDRIPLTIKSAEQFQDLIQKDKDTVYNFVNAIAREYYGRKFMVRLPYTVGKIDPDSAANNGKEIFTTTEEPSDGGWTDEPNIIGLDNNSIFTDFFSLPDNRLGCFVGVPVSSGLDVTHMNPESYWIQQNQLTGEDWIYVKASVDKNIVYSNRFDLSYPRVVVTLEQPILELNSEDYIHGIPAYKAGLMAYFNRSNASQAAFEYARAILASGQIGHQTAWSSLPNRPIMIEAAAVPMVSNVQRYGPWISNFTVHGVSKIEADDGLVPWEYGSTQNMNLVGATRALNETASSMQFGETGSIEVPGYPTIPLGAELGAEASGVFAGGFHLIETRSPGTGNGSISDGSFGFVNGQAWQGLYGPNITGISVEVGISQITTTYQMRTYTPAYARFSRLNAERLKGFGQTNLRAQKMFRLFDLTQSRRAGGFARQAVVARDVYVTEGDPLKRLRREKSNSPHEIIVGQNITSWYSGSTRALIATLEANEVAQEFEGSFGQKAFASMDFLFRPVSMYGDGGLPRYMAPDPFEVNKTNTAGAMPPMLVPDTGNPSVLNDAYRLTITTDYLNPLNSNSSNMHGTAPGHDISVLGHGSEAPTDSLNLYVKNDGIRPDYQSDYRFTAWKGPIVIQQWGLDTDGKPVPNYVDDETDIAAGIYANSGLKDQYMDDWMVKSHTWPVAPLDLRLDRKRGLWVSPPANRLVIGLAIENIPSGGDGLCQLVEGDDLYGSDGTVLHPSPVPCWCAPRFRVTDKIGDSITEGTVLIAHYNAATDEYWSLEKRPGTTTTTTPAPTGVASIPTCTGVCKWDWSVGDNAWNLATSGCGKATTSTTPAPTGTTLNPCNCPTTTTNPSITTTTTASPTTTPNPCSCAYPTFCGSGTMCTYTDCVGGNITNKVTCTTSTTSTTPGIPTTTTTSDPCFYSYLPGGGWIQTGGGCNCQPPEDDCPGGCCGEPGTEGPAPESIPCEGKCEYTWIIDYGWYNFKNTCAGGQYFDTDSNGCYILRDVGCFCKEPNAPGSYPCAVESASCQSPEPPTGTTAEPTTTTPHPCASGCDFSWENGVSWSQTYNGCLGDCSCYSPARAGRDTCERIHVSCVSGTTSTLPPYYCYTPGGVGVGSGCPGGICTNDTSGAAGSGLGLCFGTAYSTYSECISAGVCNVTTTTTQTPTTTTATPTTTTTTITPTTTTTTAGPTTTTTALPTTTTTACVCGPTIADVPCHLYCAEVGGPVPIIQGPGPGAAGECIGDCCECVANFDGIDWRVGMDCSDYPGLSEDGVCTPTTAPP